MDGYAIRAKDTFGITEREPRWLELGVQAIQVDTGDPVPEGMDAVVMLEEVLQSGERRNLASGSSRSLESCPTSR